MRRFKRFALLFAAGVLLSSTPACSKKVYKKCCKVCKKSKACGDSCISRDKKCNKPKGCACNE